MISNRHSVLFVLCLFSLGAFSDSSYLVKFRDNTGFTDQQTFADEFGGELTQVSEIGRLHKWTPKKAINIDQMDDARIEYIEKNAPIQLFANPSLEKYRAQLSVLLDAEKKKERAAEPAYPDDPDIKTPPTLKTGTDPELGKQWGMLSISAKKLWQNTPAGEGIVVAVTDTGVDYNHEDLINNMWRNPGEIPGDNIDNDKNGFVDDVVGWDFVKNDNKPYDLSMSLMTILFQGGNPGHGTHCAGAVGARGNNGTGIAGVGAKVKMMALRMIGEMGKGDLAGGVQAIDYAVKNGAHIISASWGTMGEETGSEAVRDALTRAEKAGVIFVAAAGNGKVDAASQSAKGYDNDSDAKPVFPATYPHDNIVAVAALDVNDQLGVFSNWGLKTVDLGAPGVKVMSTVPGNRYQDTIVNMGSINVTWDGTSMATPHVAGALAAIWSDNTTLTWKEVKTMLLNNTKPLSALTGKTVSEGRLDFTDMF